MADLKISVDTSEVANASRNIQQLGQSTQQTTQAVNKFGGQATHTSRGMNAMGVGIQQAGYQVGDFLVQVQSGTNAMVAFGQQATQLVGILPMFGSVMGISGTALVSLSAGLGIAIPLLTAVGAYFMRAGDSAEDFEDSLGRLEDAISSYESAVKILNSSQEELEERFGRFAAIAGRIGQELEARALREITAEVQAFANSIANTETMVGRISGATTRDLRDLLGLRSIGRDTAAIETFASAILSLDQAEGIENQVSAAENLLNTFDSIVGSQGELNSQQEAYRQRLVDLISSMIELGGTVDQEVNERLRQQLELEDEISQRVTERNQIFAKTTTELENEIRLLETILRYGEDSVEAERERNRQARATFVTEQLRAGATADQIVQMLELVRRAQELEGALRDATGEADNLLTATGLLAAVNLTGLNSQVSFLMQRLGLAADEAIRLNNALPGGGGMVGQDTGGGLSFGMGGVDTQGMGDFGSANLGFGNIPAGGRRDVSYGGAVDVPLPGSGQGGGGGADRIGALAQSLMTEMEQIQMFRTEALEQLEDFNAMELEILGGHSEARLRIESEYQSRLRQLQLAQQNQRLGEAGDFFGALASVTAQGGEKMVKATQIFGATAALINTFIAQSQVLADPTLGFFGKMAAYLKIGAAGLGLVNAIRSGGGSGGGGGGGGTIGTVGPISQTASASPQRVVIEGIDRDTLISGEQLSRLFDKLYEENNERGVVFSVAR